MRPIDKRRNRVPAPPLQLHLIVTPPLQFLPTVTHRVLLLLNATRRLQFPLNGVSAVSYRPPKTKLMAFLLNRTMCFLLHLGWSKFSSFLKPPAQYTEANIQSQRLSAACGFHVDHPLHGQQCVGRFWSRKETIGPRHRCDPFSSERVIRAPIRP